MDFYTELCRSTEFEPLSASQYELESRSEVALAVPASEESTSIPPFLKLADSRRSFKKKFEPTVFAIINHGNYFLRARFSRPSGEQGKLFLVFLAPPTHAWKTSLLPIIPNQKEQTKMVGNGQCGLN